MNCEVCWGKVKKTHGPLWQKNIGNKLKGEAVMKKLVEIWQGQNWVAFSCSILNHRAETTCVWPTFVWSIFSCGLYIVFFCFCGCGWCFVVAVQQLYNRLKFKTLTGKNQCLGPPNLWGQHFLHSFLCDQTIRAAKILTYKKVVVFNTPWDTIPGAAQ